MSGSALALRQVRYEQRSFWRNPAAAFFTVAFPLMFLVIFNLLFGEEVVGHSGRSISGSYFYVPAVAAFSVISACYTNIAISLTFNRDEGVLKRARGTPLPTWAFFFGRIASAIAIAILLVAIVAAAGVMFYEVDLPTEMLPAFLLTLIVGAAAFCSLGIAVTSIIPNADAAPAVVNATILPLLFISGVFIPLSNAPEWLQSFAGFFPVKHFADGLHKSFSPFAKQLEIPWFDLEILALWAIVGIVWAARSFRWEPRR